eukprot:298633-Chlamydomonas_euryale.AAC.4
MTCLPGRHGLPACLAACLHGLLAWLACLPAWPAWPACMPGSLPACMHGMPACMGCLHSLPACVHGLPACMACLPACLHTTSMHVCMQCRRLCTKPLLPHQHPAEVARRDKLQKRRGVGLQQVPPAGAGNPRAARHRPARRPLVAVMQSVLLLSCLGFADGTQRRVPRRFVGAVARHARAVAGARAQPLPSSVRLLWRQQRVGQVMVRRRGTIAGARVDALFRRAATLDRLLRLR